MIIVANWKAYVEDLEKAKKLVALAKKYARTSPHTIVIAPSAPFVGALAQKNSSHITFAAQDVSATLGGPQTAENTAPMYATLGVAYAIVGHSERRAMGDTNDIVAEKMLHAVAHKITPILCVGEHARDPEGRYLSFLREEITSALAPLAPKDRAKVIIAYEPLWAIGKTADQAIHATDLAEMVLYIHKILAELLPGKSSSRSLILYGGSVEPENIREIAATSRIDGFLIGHASVNETTFTQLLQHIS